SSPLAARLASTFGPWLRTPAGLRNLGACLSGGGAVAGLTAVDSFDDPRRCRPALRSQLWWCGGAVGCSEGCMSVAFGLPAGGEGEGGDERRDRDADGPPEGALEGAGGAVGEE